MLVRLYLVFFLLAACDGTTEDDKQVRVRFHAPSGCPVSEALEVLSLEARGPFPPSGAFIAPFSRPFRPEQVDRFPPATSVLVGLAAGADYQGVGVTAVGQEPVQTLPLVLAPLRQACSLDQEITFRSLPAEVFVATGDGGALLAGGRSGVAEGSRRLLRLPPTLALSDSLAPLSVARIGASATLAGDRIVIAGGSIFEDERALDTFLVVDASSAEVLIPDRSLCEHDRPGCEGRRRDHGAVALPDGRVLLFGGVRRAEGGELAEEILNSAVLIDPQLGTVESDIDRSLGGEEVVDARQHPQLLVLDHGAVVSVGGRGAGGAFTGTILRFDPVARAFRRVYRRVETTQELTTRVVPFVEGVAVPLPGARLAYFTGETTVPVLSFQAGSDVVVRHDVLLSLPDGPLAHVQAVALPDGTVFLVGKSVEGVNSYHVDLGTGTMERLPSASAPATRILSLGTGALLELSDVGVSYRRVVLRTPYDNPPATLLPSDHDWLAYDAFSGWQIDATGAHARRDARVMLAGLRLQDFSLELEVSQAVELVVQPTPDGTNRQAAVVRFDTGLVSVGLCELPWEAGIVTVTRQGDALQLRSSAGTQTCAIPSLVGEVALRLDVAADASFRRLRLNRL